MLACPLLNAFLLRQLPWQMRLKWNCLHLLILAKSLTLDQVSVIFLRADNERAAINTIGGEEGMEIGKRVGKLRLYVLCRHY